MDALLRLDGRILLWIQDNLRFEPLNGAVRFITSLGDAGAVWIVLTIILLLFRRTRKAGLAGALALLFGLLATNIALKNLIRRPRPFDEISALTILIRRPTDFSFPSGHTTASFAAGWTMLKMLPRKHGVPALVLAVLIALSRLYLGVHYPTDVLGGLAVGVAASQLAMLIVRRTSARFHSL